MSSWGTCHKLGELGRQVQDGKLMPGDNSITVNLLIK